MDEESGCEHQGQNLNKAGGNIVTWSDVTQRAHNIIIITPLYAARISFIIPSPLTHVKQ